MSNVRKLECIIPSIEDNTIEEVIEIIKRLKETETNPGKLIGLTAKEVGNRFDKSKIAALVKQV